MERSHFEVAATFDPERALWLLKTSSARDPSGRDVTCANDIGLKRRKREVRISVTNNPTAEWIGGQVTDAFPWEKAPRHLIRDRDGAFGPAYTRRIHAMGIRDHPIAPRSPWQNGHVERLIGSIRRESLDHLIVFGEAHLRGFLKAYASYYNEVRTHLSLDKDAPDFRRAQKFGRIAAMPIRSALHHQYVRI